MATKDATVYVANESFTTGDGEGFVKDATRVSAAWLNKHKDMKDLFKPLEVHYDVASAEPKVEQATAAPGEKREKK
jgi:hypothetical protein